MLLGLIALIYPEVGENRIWLGCILIFVVAPLATILEYVAPVSNEIPTQPVLDVFTTITLIHLCPEVWHAAFIAGGLTANSTSVHLCKAAIWIYPCLNTIFLTGMAFAAVFHGVDNWYLSVLAYAACLPSLTSFLHGSVNRHLEMIEQSQRLQNLSLIAGGVAHDFNNILGGIVGYADLAKTQALKGKPVTDSLDDLLTSTQRAKLLTGQLLSFANRELRAETHIELVSEVRELIPLLKSIAKCHEIEFQSTTPQIYLKGDRAQIQQVFMNLILNAAESMPCDSNGKVTVNLHVDATDRAAPKCVCVISDKGCGIPENLIQKVFIPFFTSKETGHGMGLACTARIVGEHGGQIAIDSQVGEGTTVTVTFPVAPMEGPTEPKKPHRSPGNHLRKRVLVVDDDNNLRKVLQLQLKHLGFEPFAVGSGEEAVALFEADGQCFDCVLLDLKMQGMDGWACRRHLLALAPEIPIILMSGFAPLPPPEEDSEDGSFSFLSKPFSQKDLLAALDDSILES